MNINKWMTATAVSIGLMAGSTLATAQEQDWSKVEIKTEKVSGNIYVLFGQGGNIGVSVGEDGVYIIDDQFAPLTEKIKAAIAALSDKPIRFAINTHYHGDHTGGNENLGKEGTIIVAHDNVRIRMKKGTFLKAFNDHVPPKEGLALPVVTFNDQAGLHLNGEQARMHYVANAHTDGDSIVYFEGSNVVHMGDTFFAGMFPFIDVDSGGSVDGMIAAANKVLAMVNGETRIIPGHGQVTDNKGLTSYRDMLVTVRGRVAEMKSAGKTLEEVQAENPVADFLDSFVGFSAEWPKLFVGFVFNSL